MAKKSRPEPRQARPAPAPPGPPPQPEVRPTATDPVREHTAGDEPQFPGPDPRLWVEFF